VAGENARKAAGGPGRLIVVSAPSGAGKTSLVRALLDRDPTIRVSTSYTTRPRRPGEVDGEHYYFVTPERFAAMVDEGAFLEHARVFDHSYGTAAEVVRDLTEAGHDVLLEIDWQGARQVRSAMPGCVSIFILPPSLAELERRLRGRGTDADDVIRRRLRDARDDMAHWREFDFVVVNDDFEEALGSLRAILRGDGADAATDSEAARARVAVVTA
jgi:guanylate kinase